MYYSELIKYDGSLGRTRRTVLRVSGCSFQCRNCARPQTWDPYYGREFTEEDKKVLFDALDKDTIDGLTLTGGEPLYESSLDCVLDIVKEFRERYSDKKTIWLYTGFLWEDIFHGDIISFSGVTSKSKRREIVSQCDLVIDGRYVDELSGKLAYRGSSNQRVIDVKESLRLNEVVVFWFNSEK